MRPPASRLLLTGALTLTSAFGVETLQGASNQEGSSAETVYSVSSTNGLGRLSADAVTARADAATETQDGDAAASAGAESEAERELQVRAEPGEAPQLQRVQPKIRTAENPAPASEPAAPEPVVPETPQPPPPPPPPPPEVDPVWNSLAGCESGGNWEINTGNGYYGGLQFSVESWQGVGGDGYPHEHPKEVQIAMAERLKSLQGWNAWPVCSRRLGLI